jgi:rabenosyn-5
MFFWKQSLPVPKRSQSTTESEIVKLDPSSSAIIDPDSTTAHALQPLLEQEALLESFVEEAKAHRKFEDVRTLKANLAEIRGEIERIMDGATPVAQK